MTWRKSGVLTELSSRLFVFTEYVFFAEGKVVIQRQFLPTADRSNRTINSGADERNIGVVGVIQVLVQAQRVQAVPRQPVKTAVMLAKVLKQTAGCSR